MSRKRRITAMKVIEKRPVYNSKEEEMEALGRGALKLAMIEQEYIKRNASNDESTA